MQSSTIALPETVRMWPPSDLRHTVSVIIHEYPTSDRNQVVAAVNLAARAVRVEEGHVQLTICARRFLRALL